MGACHSTSAIGEDTQQHPTHAIHQPPHSAHASDSKSAAAAAAACAVVTPTLRRHASRPAAPPSPPALAHSHNSSAAVAPVAAPCFALSADKEAAAEAALKAAPARVPLPIQSRTLRQSSLASGWRFEAPHQHQRECSTSLVAATSAVQPVRTLRRNESAALSLRRDGDVSARGSLSVPSGSTSARRSDRRCSATNQHVRADISDAELLRELDALLESRVCVAAPVPPTAHGVSEALASARRSARERTRPNGMVSAVAAHPLLEELADACAASTLTDAEIAEFALADHAPTDSDAERDDDDAAQPDDAAVDDDTPQLLCVERSVSSRFDQPAGVPASPAAHTNAIDTFVADCCSGWLSASASGLLRPCTRLVCVRCSQRVVWIDARRWSSPTAASYLFLRTHHPSLMALHPATLADPMRRAYACQCAAVDVDEEAVGGMQTQAIDGSKLQWRCGGGHARQHAAEEDEKLQLAQSRLLQELRCRPAAASSTIADQIAALRPSAINFDDDDDGMAAPVSLVAATHSRARSGSLIGTLPPLRLPNKRTHGSSNSQELNPFTIA